MISLWFVSKSLKNNLHSQPPDILTWSIEQPVALSNLRITISGGCTTSGHCNRKVTQPPDFVQPLGIVTRYPESATKETFYHGGYSRAYVLLIHEKTRARKSHATVPLMYLLHCTNMYLFKHFSNFFAKFFYWCTFLRNLMTYGDCLDQADGIIFMDHLASSTCQIQVS